MRVNRKHIWLSAMILLFGLYACEKELELDIPVGTEDVVVYGFIEQGRFPVVMLTKSLPVFEDLDLNTIADIFVRVASVQISDGINTITLDEFSAFELKDEPFIIAMGLEAPETAPIFFYYPKLNDRVDSIIVGKEHGSYDLVISAEGKVLTAFTTIPTILPVDSMWVTDHPDPDNYPELVRFWAAYADPAASRDFIRYFTKRNSEPFYPGYFQSVFSDELLNGKRIEFPLDKGQTFEPDTFETYGYFTRGDTIILRWASIDQEHFNFWRTVEADKLSAGSPFGTPTKIESNIVGGLGIWGGYGTYYRTLLVPK